MKPLSEQLYELLPAIYRIRDAEQGGPLKSLLAVISEQMGYVEDDIAQLYDDWFIETASEWVVAYLGDLLGVRGLHQVQEAGFTHRARVANTLGYRRRKGTATMLEQLARDTTLWSARVVEYFQLLATTQYLNHLRLFNHRTPDLRQVNRLQLLDGPFDTIAHTADVRHISNGRGRHNIPNIGIFLWRLQSYELNGIPPRPAGTVPDGRFTFSPLGDPIPLFNRPQTETSITHLAEETEVPGAIRPLAFFLDLQSYQQRSLLLKPVVRPRRSDYYGPGASLEVIQNSTSLSPLDVACMDLSTWARPPARVRGVYSGALPATLTLTAGLSANTPSVAVTIGGEGPHPAVLPTVPTTPAEAAGLLASAIRSAGSTPAFTQAQVLLAGDRLLVLPGEPGLAVTFAVTGSDATTLAELGLDALVLVDAALSSPLKPFPTLRVGRVVASIAGVGPHELNLAPIPTTLEDARQNLETALQGADADPAFADAVVLTLDDRLLAAPGISSGGTSAGPVTFTASPTDSASVYRLGLNDRVGIDVELGRIAFPLGIDPGTVQVDYSYGFSGDLGGGPYDRRRLRRPGEPDLAPYENTVAGPDGLGQRLKVSTRVEDFSTLTLALDHWKNVLGGPDAVIEIEDNRTYAETLAIDLGSADLVIQAGNKLRPLITGDLTVNGAGQGRLALNGLLISGTLTVQGGASLRQLDVIHSTLVPGRRLDEAGQAVDADSPSLVVADANPDLQVSLLRSISGPLQLPTDIAGLSVQDCLLEAPLRSKSGSVTPALVSGPLAAINLTSGAPTLNVTIGDEGPYPVTLLPKPTTLAQVRDRLEAALKNLKKGRAFDNAHVLTAGTRLLVLPGTPAVLRFENAGADGSASQLRLVSGQAEPRFALVSGPVQTLPLSAAAPAVTITLGEETGLVKVLPPANLSQARDNLQTGIRNTGASQAFTGALVASISAENRLVILPGTGKAAPRFSVSPPDTETLFELSLESDHFVLAATPTGEQPAPPSSLVRTTVLGPVHVKELALGSESIFAGLVIADRRQAGCVRFSYVPPGSRTPVRYHCQPDLEVDAETNEQKPKTALEAAQLRQRILGWLVPSFTSTRYGSPAYGQLSRTCPEQIRTGAEDGSEMGAFYFLKQPQREANLRASLDEYLRFGLEAGIFFVT